MKQLFRKFKKYFWGLLWGGLICLFPSFVIYSEVPDMSPEEEIFMIRGDLETIKGDGLIRISISNPEIADIVNIGTDSILILAKTQGKTNAFLWDQQRKWSMVIHVFDDNLDLVKSRIEYLLHKINIKGISLEKSGQENKVIVSGEISSAEKPKLDGILGTFSQNILNLIQTKEEKDLIQIDAQIAELNTNVIKKLGIDWTSASALTFTETNPGIPIDKPWDAFRIGEFRRTSPNGITSILNALITEGNGRVLSRPKIVVKSGQSANFNVGGQIPVTTRTIQNTTILENIVYRSYGVGLNVTPTLREDGKVDIQLSIDVSDVDTSTSSAGNVGFTSRTVSTRLYLANGQTVVLAGLIKKNKGQSVTRLPFLSDIPVFGAIFRNKNFTPNTETELVISLTPTVFFNKKEDKSSPQGVALGDKAGQGDKSQMPATGGSSNLTSQIFNNSQGMVNSYLSDDMLSYVRSMQENIAQHIVYPEEARLNSWQGTVRLALRILNDGTLVEASVKESSGYELFDNNALLTAKNLAPYSAFPSNTTLQELTVTIPLVYSLDTY